jgi:hypothetical protein
MPLRHPCTDFLLEFDQPFGLAGRQLLQVGCSVLSMRSSLLAGNPVYLGSEARSIRP